MTDQIYKYKIFPIMKKLSNKTFLNFEKEIFHQILIIQQFHNSINHS